MAYRRENYLNRVKKVNEVYIPLARKGIPNETIFREHIQRQFDISRSTFYEYLTIPYTTELEKIRSKTVKSA